MHAMGDEAVTVNFNSDWSGEAIVIYQWPNGAERQQWHVNARDLAAGCADVHPGQTVPVPVMLRATAIAAAAYVRGVVAVVLDGVNVSTSR